MRLDILLSILAYSRNPRLTSPMASLNMMCGNSILFFRKLSTPSSWVARATTESSASGSTRSHTCRLAAGAVSLPANAPGAPTNSRHRWASVVSRFMSVQRREVE